MSSGTSLVTSAQANTHTHTHPPHITPSIAGAQDHAPPTPSTHHALNSRCTGPHPPTHPLHITPSIAGAQDHTPHTPSTHHALNSRCTGPHPPHTLNSRCTGPHPPHITPSIAGAQDHTHHTPSLSTHSMAIWSETPGHTHLIWLCHSVESHLWLVDYVGGVKEAGHIT